MVRPEICRILDREKARAGAVRKKRRARNQIEKVGARAVRKMADARNQI